MRGEAVVAVNVRRPALPPQVLLLGSYPVCTCIVCLDHWAAENRPRQCKVALPQPAENLQHGQYPLALHRQQLEHAKALSPGVIVDEPCGPRRRDRTAYFANGATQVWGSVEPCPPTFKPKPTCWPA